MGEDKKLIDVLSEIVKEFIGPFGDDVEKVEKKVVENLLDKGYDISEINDLLEKLFHMMDINYERDVKIRLINPDDISNLSDDAKEYLFGLKSKGVVGDSEFEQILAVISTYFKKIDRIELEKILKKEKLTADSILN